MISPQTPYRDLGDADLETIRRVISQRRSPMVATIEETHAAASPHSALFWAQAGFENQWQTTGNILGPEDHNPVALRPERRDDPGPHGSYVITAPDGGQFLGFARDADAALEWKRRLFDDPTYKGGVYTNTGTIEELLAVYAPSGDVHPITGLDNADAGYVTTVVSLLNAFNTTPQEAPMAPTFTDALRAKKVLINAGHRNYSKGGARGEWGWTDDAAVALAKAFRAIGWTADILQEVDGDADPDDLLGSLDRVGQVATSLDKKRGPYCFFLSQHHDGGGAPGMFCIPPGSSESKRLLPYRTRVFDGEYLSGNAGDLRLSRAVNKQVVDRTKLDYRRSNVIEPGIMAEWQTGVGAGGWRLSELFETLPMRDHCARLILEAGSIDSADGAFIHTPAFLAEYAPAVAAGVELWRRDELERAGVPVTEPTPQPVPVPEPTPTTMYGPGLDQGIAERLFGRVTDDTGVYEFSPTGLVSKLWLARGLEQNVFPALVEVWHYEDGRRYFRFADGYTIMAVGSKLTVLGG